MRTFTISLKNLKFYSPIGLFEQERLVGNEFYVNLDVIFPAPDNINDDSLDNMISYVDLYFIVKEMMMQGGKLLETIAWKIANKIIESKPIISSGTISITKLTPPISGMEGSACVTLNF